MRPNLEYVKALEKRAKQLDELISELYTVVKYELCSDNMADDLEMRPLRTGSWVKRKDLQDALMKYRSKDSE